MNNRLPLFYLVTVLFWFSLYAYVPYITPYTEELGVNLRLNGLIVSAYGFWQMIVRFPLGIFSDRLRKRKIFIIIGLCFAAVSGVCVFFFPHPFAMLLSRSFGGIAAASWVTFAILNAGYFQPEDTIKSVGYINAANAVGRLGAFLAGGFVAERFGIPYAFLLGGLAGLIGMFLGAGIIEKKPAVQKEPLKITELLKIARNRQLLCVSLLGVLSQMITFATTFGFTPMTAVQLGASNFQLGLLGMTSALPGLLLSPLAGTVLPKKFGVKYTLVVGFAVMGLATAAIPLCGNLWQLFAVQLLSSSGGTVVFTLLMGLCIYGIPNEQRATAMGFFQAVYGLGMFLGPFIMGWLSFGVGLNAAFNFIGGIGVVGMTAVIIFVKIGYLRYRH